MLQNSLLPDPRSIHIIPYIRIFYKKKNRSFGLFFVLLRKPNFNLCSQNHCCNFAVGTIRDGHDVRSSFVNNPFCSLFSFVHKKRSFFQKKIVQIVCLQKNYSFSKVFFKRNRSLVKKNKTLFFPKLCKNLFVQFSSSDFSEGSIVFVLPFIHKNFVRSKKYAQLQDREMAPLQFT